MNFENRLQKAQTEVRPFFLRLTKDPFLAEEVIQFASVQCWRNWAEKDTTELTRLMVTVGRRFYFNHREKERNQKKRLANSPPEICQATCSNDYALSGLLGQSLDQLPATWGEVLVRVFYQGQTNEEAAKALGKPLSTIKTWRRRGLERLRLILGPFHPDRRQPGDP
jgi:DNA-directed RNA polymerase specialized sigma24 family protein